MRCERVRIALLYTGALMPYHAIPTATASVPMGGKVLRACARAMGARMITTMTTAAP